MYNAPESFGSFLQEGQFYDLRLRKELLLFAGSWWLEAAREKSAVQDVAELLLLLSLEQMSIVQELIRKGEGS